MVSGNDEEKKDKSFWMEEPTMIRRGTVKAIGLFVILFSFVNYNQTANPWLSFIFAIIGFYLIVAG